MEESWCLGGDQCEEDEWGWCWRWGDSDIIAALEPLSLSLSPIETCCWSDENVEEEDAVEKLLFAFTDL